jgi:hypothetical protein
MNKPRPGRKPRPATTPLARWLEEKGMTRAEFASLCSREGIRVRVAVVCRWAVGAAKPNQHSRALIARVTGGEVPVESWFARSRRKAA